MQGLAEAIRDNYRVIALDQRGHGESGRPSSFANDRMSTTHWHCWII
nr:hypothetical protein [Planifilum fimeticola]